MILSAASTRGCVRPFTTTLAPSAASAAAIAKPIPAVEPDTTASLPCNPKFIVYPLAGPFRPGGGLHFPYFFRGPLGFPRPPCLLRPFCLSVSPPCPRGLGEG